MRFVFSKTPKTGISEFINLKLSKYYPKPDVLFYNKKLISILQSFAKMQ